MEHSFRNILLKLCRREDLSADEAGWAFEHLMGGQATEAQIGGLLVGLAAKGTTADELLGAARVMREKSIRVETPDDSVVLDTCGTGGDVRATFNISTAAALIVAAAGVRVVKHGNRSATSKSGSADVLERLGVNLDASAAGLADCLSKANICFAFARHHHPAMKFVAAARAALGIPTIFNMLGPLANPARARHQLIGVFAPELTERFALVLKELGSRRAWVVHAHDGLDELSTLGPTRISELRDGAIATRDFDAASLGLPTAKLTDLQVDSLDQAADALRAVLAGAKGPMRDIALLNAAGSLVVAEAEAGMPAALARAALAVDSGAANSALDHLIAATNA